MMRQFQEQGLKGEDLLQAVEAINVQIIPLIEPAILFFHRKSRGRAARDDATVVMAEAAGLLQEKGPPGQMPAAIVFVDLSSFTPLTEAMGDEKAAGGLGGCSSPGAGGARGRGGGGGRGAAPGAGDGGGQDRVERAAGRGVRAAGQAAAEGAGERTGAVRGAG